MKLALIYPPFFHKKFNENLPTVDDEFGLFPHISFGWIAAAVKQSGHEVKLFDAAASKRSYEWVLEDIKDYNPDVLGFAAHAIQTFQDMLLWALKLKRDTGLPTVVGGYEAKIYPFEIMEHTCFDYLCTGEATTFMGPFLNALEKGNSFSKVPDLLYRSNGMIKKTIDAPFIAFNQHPHPDRSIFKNELYYSHVSSKHNFTIGMSEVGCPYPCSFCAMRHTGFDARSAIQIADEMEDCVKNHNIHEIDWFDPVMLHNRQRIIDFSKEINKRHLDIIWSTRARIDSITFNKLNGKIDEQLLQALAESGCKRLFFGIESGDDQVLKNIQKGLKVSSVHKVLDACKSYDIRPLGFFMIGNPGETIESANRTITFAKTLPLDYAQFTITIAKPHSDLEKQNIKDADGFDYWREYIRGTVEEQILPTPWTNLSRAELEKLSRRAYLHFYFRPKYMWMMIRRLESRKELPRYIRVFIQLFLRPIRPQRNKKMSFFVKISRVILAFTEGLVASLNGGARHPVAAYGGGFKGAVALAQREWKRSTTLKDLPSPGTENETLMKENSKGKTINRQDQDKVTSRYIPLSSGTLGVKR